MHKFEETKIAEGLRISGKTNTKLKLFSMSVQIATNVKQIIKSYSLLVAGHLGRKRILLCRNN